MGLIHRVCAYNSISGKAGPTRGLVTVNVDTGGGHVTLDGGHVTLDEVMWH